jgi:hypothetical protein
VRDTRAKRVSSCGKKSSKHYQSVGIGVEVKKKAAACDITRASTKKKLSKPKEKNDYKFKAKKTYKTTLLQSVVLSTGGEADFEFRWIKKKN